MGNSPHTHITNYKDIAAMTGSNIVFEIDYSTYENRGYGNEANFKMTVGNKCLTEWWNRERDKAPVKHSSLEVYVDDLIDWFQCYLDEYMYLDTIPNDDEDSDIVEEFNWNHSLQSIGCGIIWPNVKMYRHSNMSLHNVCITVGRRAYKPKNVPDVHMEYSISNLQILVPVEDFVSAVQNMLNKHKEYLENHK